MSAPSLSRKDQQSYVDRLNVDVIFDGSVDFSQSGHTMDVVIGVHHSFDMIEVIVHDPNTSKEAPRLYVHVSDVVTFLDTAKINASLGEIRSQCFLQGIDFDRAEEA